MRSYEFWDPLNLRVPYGDLDRLIATHIADISGLVISDYQIWMGKQIMTLYEYTIFYVPRAGGKGDILVPPTPLLAKCERDVNVVASRAIPEDYLDKLDEVVIKVRPF